MSFSRRRLPHIHPSRKWLFVTWHLDGSLPLSLFPPPGKNSDGKAFVWMDRYLDTTRKGPRHLLRPEIAAIVGRSIRRGVSLGQYELRALRLPLLSPSRLLQSLKGNTSREANLVLDRTGRKFWQAESYDHWARDDAERERNAAYIESNPVRAGLIDRADRYRWSSAGKSVEMSLDAGRGRDSGWTRCPPHSPVLALLTHTVLTLDWGISGVETHVRIRLQDLDWR
jgi:putative transposase